MQAARIALLMFNQKMLTTTIVLLATIATCYAFSVSLVVSDNNNNNRTPNLAYHNDNGQHASEISRGKSSIVNRFEQIARGVPGKRTRRAAPASIETGGVSAARGGLGVSGRPAAVTTAPGKQRKGPNRQANQAENEEMTTTMTTTTTTTTSTSAAAAEVSRSIKNVTAQNGQSVLLPCLVDPTADVSVSWFRGTGELQLLSYGTTTIIQDDRFIVRPGASRDNDCALQIKNLDKATDSGLYQCQTSEEPPQSQYYQLNVVEPQVAILGSPDLAVKLGAPINLTCVISQSADQFQFIFWYRDERMINYDIANEARGKIVVSKLASNRLDSLTSSLQIFQSKLSDSGNYTCAPSGARSTSIYVHILEASSQSTNSAISAHVARLSRGRAYALFVAYFIFSTWFQLVAQLQTAISLFLLAIIGLFISSSTRELQPKSSQATGVRRLDLRSLEEDKKLLKKKKLAESDDDDDGDVKLIMRYKLNVSSSDDYDQRREVIKRRPEEEPDEDADDQRHLERANSALELLRRSLQVVASSGAQDGEEDDDDDDGDSTVFNQVDGTTNTRRDCKLETSRGQLGAVDNRLDNRAHSCKSNKINQLNRRPTPLLTSPSASTSSGNSTGYNSDSRQTCPDTPTSNTATDRLERLVCPRLEVAGGSGRAAWLKAASVAANNRVLINDSRVRVADDKDNNDNSEQQALEMIDLLRGDQRIAMSLLFEDNSSCVDSAGSSSLAKSKVDSRPAPVPAGATAIDQLQPGEAVLWGSDCASTCSASSSSAANREEPHYATPTEGTTNSRHEHHNDNDHQHQDNGPQAPPLGGPT